MKMLFAMTLLAMFACGGAYAADDKAATASTTDTKTNAQQNKMKSCQAEATAKKLESTARQDYVNNCLKAKPVATEDKAKSKMAMCNEKTKGMSKPDADKARSECMKAS